MAARKMDREPRYNVQVADIRKNAQEHLRIELHEFNGYDLVSLRVWFEKGGEMLPSAKGVTISAALIPQLRKAFEAAERVAAERGILSSDEEPRT